MINSQEAQRRVDARAGEEGYVFLGVLFLVFLVMVALSIAVPKMAASIERDREVELQHRGKQYVRAIKLYYKKFGAYPPTLDALEKQNEIRFLRRRYKDPITGKADWKTIGFGQNKMPTTWGFFNTPMAGSTLAGIGPGAQGGGAFGGGAAGSSAFGSSSFGSSSFGSSGGLGSSSGLGSNNGLGTTNNAAGTTATGGSTTDGSGNATSGSTSGSTSGTGSGDSSSGSSSSSGSTSAFGGTGSGLSGQTFGGVGIIGVESVSTKKSILEYHKKAHFNEWEFCYDPMQDQMMMGGNTGTGLPGSGTPTNGVQTPGTFGGQAPGSSIPPPTQQPMPTPAPSQPTTPQ